MQRRIELAGSSRAMGRQHGEALREETRAMCELRLGLVQEKLRESGHEVGRENLLALAREHVQPHAEYCPRAYEELTGIAEGAGVTVEELVVGNGYTDFVDVAIRRFARENPDTTTSECTFIAAWNGTVAPTGLILGQTWDMHASVSPYIILVRRKPDSGPATVSLTTAGALSLIGMNEHGVCVGNTNLTARDARPGVIYLATIHTMLAQTTLEDAVKVCAASPRASSHYFYAADASGRFAALECTAERHARMQPVGHQFAHTNHYLDAELRRLARDPADDNTLQRLERAQTLLPGLDRPVAIDAMTSVLRDTKMAFPICRTATDPMEAASVAAVLMEPEKRTFNYVIGDPREADFQTIRF